MNVNTFDFEQSIYNTEISGNSIGSYAGNALLAYASKALFRPTALFIVPTIRVTAHS